MRWRGKVSLVNMYVWSRIANQAHIVLQMNSIDDVGDVVTSRKIVEY